MTPDEIARRLGAVAAEAGRLLAAVPDRSAGLLVKPDGSFATAADHASEALLAARLREGWPDVPIVAEEECALRGPAAVDPDGPFFLVDPLDGTRDYVAGSAEYAVAVALVVAGRPVAAAIAAPGLDRLWIAGRSAFASTLADGAPLRPASARAAPARLTVLGSRRHGDAATETAIRALPVGERLVLSSAAKFGLVASGEADLYLRVGPTMEWDTAAGDHIVTAAGGRTVGCGGTPILYGRPGRRWLNGAFAAAGDPATLALLDRPGGPLSG